MQDFFGYIQVNVVKVSVAAIALTAILSIVYSLGVSVYLSIAAFVLITVILFIMIIALVLNTFPELFRAIKILPKE